MRYVLAATTVVAVALAGYSTADAGAKGGKIRWSSNKDIQNGKPAIKVPPAQEKKEGTAVLKIVFKAKELAEFCVIGDGDTDLDLVVLDAKGKVVVKDVDPAERGSDICICRWTPDEEQEYTIVIVNNGKVYNLAQAGCN